MKKMSVLCLLFIFNISCQSKSDYKAARTEVVKIHDEVMVYSGLAEKRKMKLDTLFTKMDSLYKIKSVSDTLSEKQQIEGLSNRLQEVDTKMDHWMHDFNPSLDGQSNKEAVAYFQLEKDKIEALEVLYKQVLKDADDYLLRFK